MLQSGQIVSFPFCNLLRKSTSLTELRALGFAEIPYGQGSRVYSVLAIATKPVRIAHYLREGDLSAEGWLGKCNTNECPGEESNRINDESFIWLQVAIGQV